MLQLKKSVHLDSLRQPFKTAIVTAASMGADAVEINGRSEIRASEMSRTAIRHIRKLLADHNLKVSAIHFQTRYGYGDLDYLDERVEGTKATLQMAYELGCNVVVNRIGKIPATAEDERWSTMFQALVDVGNFSQKAGAWLAARTGPDDGETLKGLIDALPVHHLTVDFDPAELLINGHSPAESMQHLASHVMSFRARDAVNDLSLGRAIEVQLSRGSVDWAALLGKLEERSYQGYLTVHRESSENPVLECRQGLEFLTNLFG